MNNLMGFLVLILVLSALGCAVPPPSVEYAKNEHAKANARVTILANQLTRAEAKMAHLETPKGKEELSQKISNLKEELAEAYRERGAAWDMLILAQDREKIKEVFPENGSVEAAK